ncbi:MAG: radical SAM protein [Myxococcota bacterium]
MEPSQQVEIQLGHMCNNRCVFCVSGQRTAMGEAKPLPLAPILERISEAWASGHRKITLLGGEPTLQPGFLDVVRHCVKTGFEEVVIFTNGVKTARGQVIDDVLATGANVTWRISIQGATEEAHVGTTKKPQSFKRILRTLENLQARGERITINMCVVQSNYAYVPAFVDLVERFGVVQLHLDMMRPLDAGKRSEEELREMIPRLSDLRAPFEAMVNGFEARLPGFDVNLGNVPYCVAPSLAPWIHHDGNLTETVAIDGDDKLSKPWNKYLIKRRDKIKAETCRQCVFDDACSGVFETYAQFHGVEELVPVTAAQLVQLDPKRRLLARQLRPLTTRLRGEGFSCGERGDAEVELEKDGARFRINRNPGVARYEGFGVHVLAEGSGSVHRNLADVLADEGYKAIVPLGERSAARTVAIRLRRLREQAPFESLRWTRLEVHEGRAELDFHAYDGGRARLWLDETEGRARGGYEVDGSPTPGLVNGMREVLAALRVRGGR